MSTDTNPSPSNFTIPEGWSVADMVTQVRVHVAKLQAEYRLLEVNRLRAARKRSDLPNKPVPRYDVRKFVLDYIDARGKDFLPALEREINRFLNPARTLSSVTRGPLSFAEMQALLGKPVNELSSLDQTFRAVRPVPGRLLDDAFYLLFGDALKEAIDALWPQMNIQYDDSGAGTDRETRNSELVECYNEVAEIAERQRNVAAELRKLDADIPSAVNSPALSAEHARDLVQLVGAAAAIRFTLAMKGEAYVVPATIENAADLVQLLGAEKAGVLVAALGGLIIEIPTAYLVPLYNERQKEIQARLKRDGNRESVPAMANHYGLTEREIHEYADAIGTPTRSVQA